MSSSRSLSLSKQRSRRRSNAARITLTVERQGRLTDDVRRLNEEVFGSKIDEDAWHERLAAGRSWVVSTQNTFVVAHERDDMINVWLAGSSKRVRGSGEFKLVVRTLLNELPLSAVISATTFPDKFPKMYGILSFVASRCDRPEDKQVGKARFSMRVWQLHMFMNRRTYMRKARKVATGLFAVAAIAGMYLARPKAPVVL